MPYFIQHGNSQITAVSSPAEALRFVGEMLEGQPICLGEEFSVFNGKAQKVGSIEAGEGGQLAYRSVADEVLAPFAVNANDNDEQGRFYDLSKESEDFPVVCVALNETANFPEDIQQSAGRIYGLYWFDPTETTYACELQPSYRLSGYGYVSSKRLDDDLDEVVRGAFTCEESKDRYYHCSVIRRMTPEAFSLLPIDRSTMDPGDSREFESEVEDALSANVVEPPMAHLDLANPQGAPRGPSTSPSL